MARTVLLMLVVVLAVAAEPAQQQDPQVEALKPVAFVQKYLDAELLLVGDPATFLAEQVRILPDHQVLRQTHGFTRDEVERGATVTRTKYLELMVPVRELDPNPKDKEAEQFNEHRRREIRTIFAKLVFLETSAFTGAMPIPEQMTGRYRDRVTDMAVGVDRSSVAVFGFIGKDDEGKLLEEPYNDKPMLFVLARVEGGAGWVITHTY